MIHKIFSKAFDQINHAILITKLELIGIYSTLLCWIKSYLKNFKFEAGVSQGSHLGPLLFCMLTTMEST